MILARWDAIREGVRRGAEAWAAYGVAECGFPVLLPSALDWPEPYRPLHWGFTAPLLLAYPALGAVLGSAVGGLIACGETPVVVEGRTRAGAAATLTVVAAFAANSAVQTRLDALGSPRPITSKTVGSTSTSCTSSARRRPGGKRSG